MREGGQERPAEEVAPILRSERGGGCDKHSGRAPAEARGLECAPEEWKQKTEEQGWSQRAAQPEVRPQRGLCRSRPDRRAPGKLPGTCEERESVKEGVDIVERGQVR